MSSSSAAAPPSWWWLGDELWKNVHDEPATKAALDVMLNPPKRKRAEEQDAAAAASSTAPSEPAAAAKAEPPPRLVDKRVELQLDELKHDGERNPLLALRRKGVALLNPEELARRRAVAQARAAAAQAAAMEAARAAAEMAAATPTGPPSGPGAKRAKKEEAAPVLPPPLPPRVLPRVEVNLNVEGFATWYEATVLLQSKSRTKVKLLHMDLEMGDDPFLVENRPKEESIASEMVRPIPPPHLTNNFMPTVGEQVELQYQNGWWPVVVKKKERGDKWVVEYEEQITHTVKRDLLRPYLIYNSAGAQWLKGK